VAPMLTPPGSDFGRILVPAGTRALVAAGAGNTRSHLEVIRPLSRSDERVGRLSKLLSKPAVQEPSVLGEGSYYFNRRHVGLLFGPLLLSQN
jgi:hypothetical protein